MRYPRLISTAKAPPTSAQNLVSQRRAAGIGTSQREHDTIRVESPSGEEGTPSRSGPLERCPTEDPDHHLQLKRHQNVIIAYASDDSQVKRKDRSNVIPIGP